MDLPIGGFLSHGGTPIFIIQIFVGFFALETIQIVGVPPMTSETPNSTWSCSIAMLIHRWVPLDSPAVCDSEHVGGSDRLHRFLRFLRTGALCSHLCCKHVSTATNCGWIGWIGWIEDVPLRYIDCNFSLSHRLYMYIIWISWDNDKISIGESTSLYTESGILAILTTRV